MLAVLMETGHEHAVMTLAASISGDASLYFSSGGGLIGGFAHEPVRIAAQRFTQFAGIYIPAMTQSTDHPLPGFQQTTFYVITGGGVFAQTAPEPLLSIGAHEFAPLFHLGHYVISRLRIEIEKRSPSHVSVSDGLSQDGGGHA